MDRRDADIPDLLILGATGKVGQLLRAAQPGCAPDLRVLWQGRSAPAAPGWTRWQPGAPLPGAHLVLVLSGVTGGDAQALGRNAEIAQAVGLAARQGGVGAVLLASSIAVYGQALAGNPSEEAAPQDPAPYGAAKLAAEAALRAAAGPLPVVALRLGNVLGADLLGRLVAEGGQITLDRFASGQGALRSYTSARQIWGAVAALRHRQRQGQVLPDCLNVAGQRPVAMDDLLAAAGIPFGWRPAPAAALERAAMDCRRLAAILPPDPVAENAAGLARDWMERGAR